jgi:hypothetical protein
LDGALLLKAHDSSHSKHFPTASATTSSTILCSSCALNQQKIVQCLQAFEPSTNASAANGRRQYELFAEKLDGRYPLCATCSYKVSMKLKACQDRALQHQRHTLLVPKLDTSGAAGRAKLAEEHNSRTNRLALLKSLLFFYPEILIQGALMAACLFKKEYFVDAMVLREWRLELDTQLVQLRLWLPAVWSHCASPWYFAHILFLGLFLVQFHGIALNGRGLHALIFQAFLLCTRIAVANSLVILYPETVRPSKVVSLALAAMGLAVTCAVGSQNGQSRRVKAKRRLAASGGLSGLKPALGTDFTGANHPSLHARSLKLQPLNAPKDGGFSKYSDSRYRYHSFANMGVLEEKAIKPYSIKPLPGNMTVPERHFDLNVHNSADAKRASAMRPTILDANDSLGLEPMFSSFSLSDSSHEATSADKENVFTYTAQSAQSMQPSRRRAVESDSAFKFERIASSSRKSSLERKPIIRMGLGLVSWYLVTNLLVTVSLLACRCLVQGRTSLEAVVLAASFGLRGFFWSRLAIQSQIALIFVALARLALLAAQATERITIGSHVLWPVFFVDLVLIGLR